MKNTNDSEPLDELFEEYYGNQITHANCTAECMEYQNYQKLKQAILTHYRSVRDIEAALPEKKDWEYELAQSYEVEDAYNDGYNQAIKDMCSSLNLDGGTKL